MALEIENDAVWTGSGEVQALASFAGNYGPFGYYTDLGEEGATGTVLFDVPNISGWQTGSAEWGWIGDDVDPVSLTVDGEFGFFYLPEGNATGHDELVLGDAFYSEMALNPGGLDNMLTYSTPIPGEYFLAWSDTPVTGFYDPHLEADQDFNDLVVIVRDGAAPRAEPVPEPATMLLMGSGLIGLAGWGRRKFRR
jgi:hypothetical protein